MTTMTQAKLKSGISQLRKELAPLWDDEVVNKAIVTFQEFEGQEGWHVDAGHGPWFLGADLASAKEAIQGAVARAAADDGSPVEEATLDGEVIDNTPAPAVDKAAEKAAAAAEKAAAKQAVADQKAEAKAAKEAEKAAAKVAKEAEKAEAKAAKEAAKAPAAPTEPQFYPIIGDIPEFDDGEELLVCRIDHVPYNLTKAQFENVDAKALQLGFKNFRDYCRHQLEFMLDRINDEYSEATAGGKPIEIVVKSKK